MEELDSQLSALKLTAEPESVQLAVHKIIELLDNEDLDRDITVRQLLKGQLLTDLSQLLQVPGVTSINAAQLIAEVSKTEEARVPCVTVGMVPLLLAMLPDGENSIITEDKVPVCVQSCRALGNICFDNDSGRQAVDEGGGVQQLLDMLRHLLASAVTGVDRLRMVACGFLLNLSNTHETVQEKALSLGAIDVLNQYLHVYKEDESMVHMALMCVGSLTDSDRGREHVINSSIAVTMSQLFGTDISSEIQESAIELLASLSEIDEVKLQLAQSDMCEQLLQLLEEMEPCDGDNSSQMEKLVSDLIVLILTGDRSMEALYRGGQGVVFHQAQLWLQSSRPQLHTAGALAIGNFARNETNCLQLVRSGITPKLLRLLIENSSEASPTLQHAVLSALRNLAIPAPNKLVMLKCGLVDQVLTLLSVDFSAVQFKLLGTLRMSIDGQEEAAIELGTHEEFLSKLIDWCSKEDHPGVKGEANRLVAWLVKNSRSSVVMSALLRHGAVHHLVDMCSSEHAVMQNEALMALVLLATAILGDAKPEMLKENLVAQMKVLLTDDSTLPEIKSNVLTLAKTLICDGELRQQLVVADFADITQALQLPQQEEMVQKEAKELADILSSS